ncbi:MAG: thioesterase domain-containing protein, partial [Xanthobacteraceae bacterium]
SRSCVIVFHLAVTANLFLNAPIAMAQQSAHRSTGSPPQVQIDLFRGLADIFSRGMDTLTDTLNRQGYKARVYSTGGWQSVARRIAGDSARGQRDIVVLVGHSLGANATFDIASELNMQNVPVELIVTFDATRPQPVPKNVLHLVNFYQENGFGKRVSPGQGFQGELNNYDLTAETGLSHTTIEKSPRLHAMVMQKIADIVKKDLKRLQLSKPKTKKLTPAKNADAAGAVSRC